MPPSRKRLSGIFIPIFRKGEQCNEYFQENTTVILQTQVQEALQHRKEMLRVPLCKM